MAKVEDFQQLKTYPFLFQQCEEGQGADWVVTIGFDVLPHQKNSFISQHTALENRRQFFSGKAPC